MMLALILALATPQDGCVVLPDDYTAERYTASLQPSGEGLWIGGLAFGPDDIAAARPTTDPYSEIPALSIRFSRQGMRKFLEAQRCGIGGIIEISVDRIVISRPRLHERITGGEMSLSGSWETAEARDAVLARIVRR